VHRALRQDPEQGRPDVASPSAARTAPPAAERAAETHLAEAGVVVMRPAAVAVPFVCVVFVHHLVTSYR
jgi:hypothetical protein